MNGQWHVEAARRRAAIFFLLLPNCAPLRETLPYFFIYLLASFNIYPFPCHPKSALKLDPKKTPVASMESYEPFRPPAASFVTVSLDDADSIQETIPVELPQQANEVSEPSRNAPFLRGSCQHGGSIASVPTSLANSNVSNSSYPFEDMFLPLIRSKPWIFSLIYLIVTPFIWIYL